MTLEDEITRIIHTQAGHVLGTQPMTGSPPTNEELAQQVQALSAVLGGHSEALLHLAREIEDPRRQ